MKLSSILLVLVSFTALGQIPKKAEVVRALSAQYPNEPAVLFHQSEDMRLKIEDDSLKITIHHLQVTAVLVDEAGAFTRDQVYSSSFSRIQNLKAYSLVPSGKKFKRVDVTDFRETFDKDSYVFYNDSRITVFTYPAVKKYALTVLEYDEVITDPHFTGAFYFQRQLPVHKAIFSVNYEQGVKIDLHRFNFPKENWSIIEQKNDNRGSRTITLEAAAIPKIPYERKAPSLSYDAAHVIPAVAEYQTNQDRVVVLSELDDLYRWYYSFIEGRKEERSAVLHTIADEIKQQATNRKEQVRMSFEWVQDNIRYIAFEDGMRGFIPHLPSYICKQRYGDCKDMATILVNLLHLQGIDAHLTWIGTRDLPYSYQELPTPMVDNHMIAAWRDEGETFFLDATDAFVPYDLPSSFIQGKEALIALDSATYEIRPVQPVPAGSNRIVDSCWVSLENDVLVGRGKMTMEGLVKVKRMRDLIDSDSVKVAMRLKTFLEKGNNKFKLVDYQIQNLRDRYKPLVIDYTFEIPEYITKAGGSIYLNLYLRKHLNKALIEPERTRTITYPYQQQYVMYTHLTIPNDYQLDQIPESQKFTTDLLEFEARHTSSEQVAETTTITSQKYLTITPEEFDTYNQSIKKISKIYRDALILN